MKLLKITALFAFIVFVSCKKEYTCVCTNSNGMYNGGTIDATKSSAKKHCQSLSVDETTCELKD